jgi:hypothetical protein
VSKKSWVYPNREADRRKATQDDAEEPGSGYSREQAGGRGLFQDSAQAGFDPGLLVLLFE